MKRQKLDLTNDQHENENNNDDFIISSGNIENMVGKKKNIELKNIDLITRLFPTQENKYPLPRPMIVDIWKTAFPQLSSADEFLECTTQCFHNLINENYRKGSINVNIGNFMNTRQREYDKDDENKKCSTDNKSICLRKPLLNRWIWNLLHPYPNKIIDIIGGKEKIYPIEGIELLFYFPKPPFSQWDEYPINWLLISIYPYGRHHHLVNDREDQDDQNREEVYVSVGKYKSRKFKNKKNKSSQRITIDDAAKIMTKFFPVAESVDVRFSHPAKMIYNKNRLFFPIQSRKMWAKSFPANFESVTLSNPILPIDMRTIPIDGIILNVLTDINNQNINYIKPTTFDI